MMSVFLQTGLHGQDVQVDDCVSLLLLWGDLALCARFQWSLLKREKLKEHANIEVAGRHT